MGKYLQLLVEAAITLRASGQRTLLALLGILIGTGSVIAMLNIGHIAEQAALDQFRHLGTNLAVIKPDDATESHGLTAANAASLLASPGLGMGSFSVIEGTSARVQGTSASLRDIAVLGLPDELRGLLRLTAAEGRTVGTVDGGSMVALLGAGVADSLKATTGRPVVPGDRIRVDGASVVVAGITPPRKGTAFLNIDFDNSVWVPPQTLHRLSKPRLERVLVAFSDGVDPDRAARRLKGLFQNQPRSIHVKTTTALETIAELQTQMRIMTALLGAIGAIAMVVGGIGVMNIMLVSVSERRREIGLRLAVGATPADIRNQFLAESVVLTVVGGLAGTILGVLLSAGFASSTAMPFTVSFAALLSGPGISAFFGVFFGSFPATQAARLPPIEALRA